MQVLVWGFGTHVQLRGVPPDVVLNPLEERARHYRDDLTNVRGLLSCSEL